jgi:hypothetical protein
MALAIIDLQTLATTSHQIVETRSEPQGFGPAKLSSQQINKCRGTACCVRSELRA